MVSLRVYGYALTVSFCCFVLLAATQSTSPSEVNALLAVKRSLVDPMENLRNWNKGDPCTSNWTGVLCFNRVGTDGFLHVRVLQLLNMNLSGSLAPELGQLSHLLILDFMWNELTGTIPKEIGNIVSLKLLLLNGNKLSGTLPDELGNLSNLNRLQVDQNQISGPIPKSFSNLVNVKHLHMNNNSFNGQIPSELSRLSNLLHLLLDNNNISGYLPPEFYTLPKLRILQLDNNNFSKAKIPATYGNFPRLAKLSLRNCSLEGSIPDLGGMPHLRYLDLSRNNLTGPIPTNKLPDNMTTVDMSDNRLNGSIAGSFSGLPFLQRIDLRNNSLSNILGSFNLPGNVTLRLAGNPICKNSNLQKVGQYCGSEAGDYEGAENTTNSTMTCPVQACPIDNYYEYVPDSPLPCYCASPLRLGYRLKSPSFSFFSPYISSFEVYVTQSLNLDLYQLLIDSFAWEEGPRLRMYLKLFPSVDNSHSSVFNSSELQRIRDIFTSWEFPANDFYGPYELLNFTLLGPYTNMNIETEGGKVNKGILAAIIIAAVACIVAFSATVTLLIARKHVRYQHVLSRKRLSSNISLKIDGVKAFTFKEMALATNNFSSSNQVGQGGYGRVYKGILSDDIVVAIKRAEEGSLQGQKEFLTEIELLSRLHHRNLVSLIGYCDEEGEQMLVYEFMPNGTLRDWLSAKTKGSLNFSTRLRIALGSAKGILYLHTEANPAIFHRDIKATNILLDSKLISKVADFGLSRLAPLLDDEGTMPKYVSTVVKGTPGYLDPEYFLTHKLTDKSDVYSLGVVFLELLTGMQPISHGKNIVREVNMAHQSGMMFSVIDSRMGSYPSECVERFLALALSCCHDKPEKRPSMLDVVRELENILVMIPETETSLSDFTSMDSGKSLSSSSSHINREDQFVSSTVSGSDLVSGVVPSIAPR
ncbi:Protein kinase-like protein [Quillaja saponaria]|uniref:non-specific serine/threonine protein kinase n=1 Tax=Quillaja saponaria TaxID=32244 RepID=A0AAD7LMU5_QUISA|nr:Protein kinase-like protein [Quillaja saponaria]